MVYQNIMDNDWKSFYLFVFNNFLLSNKQVIYTSCIVKGFIWTPPICTTGFELQRPKQSFMDIVEPTVGHNQDHIATDRRLGQMVND